MIFNTVVSGDSGGNQNLKDFIVKNGQEYITNEQDSGSTWAFETLNLESAEWAIYYESDYPGIQETATLYFACGDTSATGNFISTSGNRFVFDTANILRYEVYGVPVTKIYIWCSNPFKKVE